MKITYLVFLLLFIAGCATVQLTPEEQAYVEHVKVQPTTISVPKAQADDVWGRAQVYISKHSSMKIQTATDYVIETYNPRKLGQYGYRITKSPNGETVDISVECVPGNILSKNGANDNAKILAYYLATGEIQERFILK